MSSFYTLGAGPSPPLALGRRFCFPLDRPCRKYDPATEGPEITAVRVALWRPAWKCGRAPPCFTMIWACVWPAPPEGWRRRRTWTILPSGAASINPPLDYRRRSSAKPPKVGQYPSFLGPGSTRSPGGGRKCRACACSSTMPRPPGLETERLHSGVLTLQPGLVPVVLRIGRTLVGQAGGGRVRPARPP